MTQINSTSCCGLREIDELDYPPDEILTTVAEDFFNDENPMAFYFFTDTRRSQNGRNLAVYITKHKLGAITTTRYKINPNSDNWLKVFVWAVNPRIFEVWFNK